MLRHRYHMSQFGCSSRRVASELLPRNWHDDVRSCIKSVRTLLDRFRVNQTDSS